MADMARRPPPRLRAFHYTGFYQYFLTISTFKRSRLFAEREAARIVTTQLARAAVAKRFSVIAYCLMPDHFHALVEASHEAADFRRFVRIFKQQSAFYWKQKTETILWQQSYFECVLRDARETTRVVEYISNNPVRAGLVTQLEDYPYVGSMTGDLKDL